MSLIGLRQCDYFRYLDSRKANVHFLVCFVSESYTISID